MWTACMISGENIPGFVAAMKLRGGDAERALSRTVSDPTTVIAMFDWTTTIPSPYDQLIHCAEEFEGVEVRIFNDWSPHADIASLRTKLKELQFKWSTLCSTT